MPKTADALFAYLRDVIYDPSNASLDVSALPGEFQTFGKGLIYFCQMVSDMKLLAKELADGNLNCAIPSRDNELASPLKKLHASLKHLSWQSQQVAKGDYSQRVEFMGDFSDAFNNMIAQLSRQRHVILDENAKLSLYVNRLLANSPTPVLMFNDRGELVYISDSYLKLCGIASADDIIGLTVKELLSPYVFGDSLAQIDTAAQSAVRETRTVVVEQAIDFTLSVSGVPRYYQILVAPMLGSAGEAIGFMILVNDTTASESARRDAERAREMAEQASRAKSEFLARMSHEMRTPMNAIIGMTQLYSLASDHQRKDECVNKIGGASRLLLSVINDVLDMSKIEAGKFEIVNAGFIFPELVTQIVDVFSLKIAECGQTLKQIIDRSIPHELIGDSQCIVQVLTNLLSNAVKFTPDGGTITFCAESLDDDGVICRVRFTVSDTGIGISKEQQARIFQSFEQADGGVSRKYGGSGLGLAISKHMIEMMGGKIWVESAVGQGSSFYFDLPLRHARSEAKPHDFTSGGPVESDEGIFAGRRILLAEDVELNREIITAMLGCTAVEIDPAFDGVEALKKFRATPESYDLILMDIQMPNMDGYETTRHIRASNLCGAATIPIIAMTANVFKEDIERCKECGMNSHIGKPVDLNIVIETLKQYL